MEPQEQFAANLRTHRRRSRLSQEALGAVSSMHRTEIGLLERSERDPQLATIVKLARALKIEPAELLAGIK
ncbi:MAG TPA: helix-turn-helix transcriptional regulator [Solirubrobacterales bacterium]